MQVETGNEPERLEVYLRMRAGTKDEQTQRILTRVNEVALEIRQGGSSSSTSSSRSIASPLDAVARVIGADRPGRVKGLGLGISTKVAYASQGSSSSGPTMEQVIAQNELLSSQVTSLTQKLDDMETNREQWWHAMFQKFGAQQFAAQQFATNSDGPVAPPDGPPVQNSPQGYGLSSRGSTHPVDVNSPVESENRSIMSGAQVERDLARHIYSGDGSPCPTSDRPTNIDQVESSSQQVPRRSARGRGRVVSQRRSGKEVSE